MELYKRKEWLYRKYWTEGLSLSQIASICNVSWVTIRNHIKKHGIKTRDITDALRIRNGISNKLCDRNWLYCQYWKRRLSSRKIAELCSCDKATILRRLKAFDIPKRRFGEARRGVPASLESRKKQSNAQRGTACRNPETLKQINKKRRGKSHRELFGSEKAGVMRAVNSKKIKEKWKESGYREKVLKRLGQRPSKPEKVFDGFTPQVVRYVGNGQWWRTLSNGKHKNPDFKVSGQNKVIEVFGGRDFFHTKGEAQDLIKKYKQIGIDCLIIWEDEIYNHPDLVLDKTIDFL